MKAAVLLTVTLTASASFAGGWEATTWRSADCAKSPMFRLVETTGLSWPDGRQAIVTFWSQRLSETDHKLLRCVDYFNTDMQATGAICYFPKSD